MLRRIQQALETDRRYQAATGLVVLGFAVAAQLLGWVDVAKFIKDYQALIGTVVGALLVVWNVNTTLRTNAENAQKQKEREVEQERTAVRAAIRAELTALHRDLAARVTTLKSMQKEGNFAVPKHFEGEALCRAYRAVLPKIGLLKDDEVRAVVRAYAEYESMIGTASSLEDFQLQLLKAGRIKLDSVNPPYTGYVSKVEYTAGYVKTAVEALGGKAELMNEMLQPVQKNKLAGP